MSHKITLNDDARDFLVYREGMGRTVEIFDIAVGSERRKGKGRLLVERMLEEIKDRRPPPSMVFAMTRIGNTLAHQFYEALGFRILGRLHNFYRESGGAEAALVWGLDV